MKFTISNRSLCDLLWDNKDRQKDSIKVILQGINAVHKFDEKFSEIIQSRLKKRFFPYYNRKWSSSKVARHRDKFEKFHEQWLDSQFVVDFDDAEEEVQNFADDDDLTKEQGDGDFDANEHVDTESNENELIETYEPVNEDFEGLQSDSHDKQKDEDLQEHANHGKRSKESSDADEEANPSKRVCFEEGSSNSNEVNVSQIGRKSVPFKESSRSTQFRRSQELANEKVTPELAQALKIWKKLSANYKKMDTKDMANYAASSRFLAMYLDLDMSAGKYKKLRAHSTTISGYDIYPPWEVIALVKKESYPSDLKFSEDGAYANLASLLSHTVKKIMLLTNREEWQNIPKILNFVGAWGMDGASGQQLTRQRWSNLTSSTA